MTTGSAVEIFSLGSSGSLYPIYLLTNGLNQSPYVYVQVPKVMNKIHLRFVHCPIKKEGSNKFRLKLV